MKNGHSKLKKTQSSEAKLGLKELLKKEALTVIQTSGPHALSLRELARRIKVSHAAPYRHYATKEDLLSAIVKDGFDELAERLNHIRQSEKNLKIQFDKMGHAYVNFVKEHPDHARLMFGGFVQCPEEHPETKQSGDQAFEALLATVIEMQEAGIFRKSNPLELAHLIWSSVHGFAMLLIDRQFEMIEADRKMLQQQGLDFSPDSAVSMISEIFLRGMGPVKRNKLR
jgi:AcrR family transcriptional regulator